MAFCVNCGQELAEGAKFCPNCGISTANRNIDNAQRKMEYDGTIHKCPNCGEILGAFTSVCPSCGYELRGTRVANSVKDFSTKIGKATSNNEKIALIRNYPIPNTKEDIFEFMILASSNISGEYNKAVFDAWRAKFDQCYQKATLVFGDDPDFEKIQNLHVQATKQISKEKAAHGINKIGVSVAVLLGIYEIIRIIKGDFAGVDILMSAFILWCVYKITNKKNRGK